MGIPYDYGSLIRQVVARVSTEASKLFCSEYVFYATRQAGVPMAWEPENGKAPYPGEFLKMGIYEPRERIR